MSSRRFYRGDGSDAPPPDPATIAAMERVAYRALDRKRRRELREWEAAMRMGARSRRAQEALDRVRAREQAIREREQAIREEAALEALPAIVMLRGVRWFRHAHIDNVSAINHEAAVLAERLEPGDPFACEIEPDQPLIWLPKVTLESHDAGA